jgi:hypothetical protein
VVPNDIKNAYFWEQNRSLVNLASLNDFLKLSGGGGGALHGVKKIKKKIFQEPQNVQTVKKIFN